MYWLADGDPVKIKTLSELPVIEYFILLDKRVTEHKKAQRRAEQNKKRKR